MNNKGSGWTLNPSKKHVGFYYYFNVFTGETIWSSPDIPQPRLQGGGTRNLVRLQNPKPVQFGKAKFPKYIPNQKQKRTNVTETGLLNRQIPQKLNGNFSNSTETASFGNGQVFAYKSNTQNTTETSNKTWWDIYADFEPSYNAQENSSLSKPFQLKPPKIKRLTKQHNRPIPSPIINSFSHRNNQICQKQVNRSPSSKQVVYYDGMHDLNVDDLRWKIIMKRRQKSASTETSQIQSKDKQKSIATTKSNVFIDITDEETLILNGDSENDDAAIVSRRLVTQNSFDSHQLRSVQSKDVKVNLFLQDTAADPLALSKIIKPNDLSNQYQNDLLSDCVKRLNLDEEHYMKNNIYNTVEEKLNVFCAEHDDLQVNMTERIEEWICCYLQIMEEFLHEIFQVTKATKFEAPCWFTQGLKRLKEVYSYNKPVCAITDSLLSICGYRFHNGIVRTNIKPNHIIKLLGGGFMLMEEFMKFIRDLDISFNIEMLQQLIASIRNPHIFKDMKAIDVAYIGNDRCQQLYGIETHGEVTNASSKKPIINNNKYIMTNMSDSDCILKVSDDGLSNGNLINHNNAVNNVKALEVNRERPTDRQYRRDVSDENETLCSNAYKTPNHNIDYRRSINNTLNGRINKAINIGKEDNLPYDKRNPYGVIQENDRRLSVDRDGLNNMLNGRINKAIHSGNNDNLTYDKRNPYDVIQENDRRLSVDRDGLNNMLNGRINKPIYSGNNDNLTYDKRNPYGIIQENDRRLSENRDGLNNMLNGRINKAITSCKEDNLTYDKRNPYSVILENDRRLSENRDGLNNMLNGRINKAITSGKEDNLTYDERNPYGVIQENDRRLSENRDGLNNMLNGRINKAITSGKEDNLTHDKRNPYGVIQENDRRLSENRDGLNNMLNGRINKAITSGKEDNLTYDERNPYGVIQGNDRRLSVDCYGSNRMLNGRINKAIHSGNKDNLTYDNRYSYDVLQENYGGINDNEVNEVANDVHVNREKSVDVVEGDESNVTDVIRTMVKTMKMALAALMRHCGNCYNELRRGDLTESRKEFLREATNQALGMATAMLLELKSIMKRDESENSPIARMLADEGQSYKLWIKNCHAQILIAENTLKLVLKVLDED